MIITDKIKVIDSILVDGRQCLFFDRDLPDGNWTNVVYKGEKLKTFPVYNMGENAIVVMYNASLKGEEITLM